MSSAADGEPSFSLQTCGPEPAVDGAADACLSMPTRQRPALTLFPDNMTQSKDPLAPAADGQTFGALGGSRHVELQANPCVFGIDCSAIFYDEVHESVVTVQPSAAKQGSMIGSTVAFVAVSRLGSFVLLTPPAGYTISAKSISSHEVLREFFVAESAPPVSVMPP